MKTTVDIADALLHRAKLAAAKRHTSLKVLIETALRETLEAQDRPPRPFRFEPHTVKGKGLQPGLSWDDWGTIRDMAYEGRGGWSR
jgi:hypothetical protein